MGIEILVSELGQTITWTTATATGPGDPDVMANDGLTLLYVWNQSAGVRDLSVTEQRQCNYKHPIQTWLVEDIPVGAVGRFGTFRRIQYNAQGGKIEVFLDVPASVSLAGVRIPNMKD